MRSKVELTAVDLFAGAGGLSEGFRQAGYRIVLGTDNDPDACATYATNFPEAQLILGDIRKTAVRSRILADGRGADVLVGGPPCQAFSQVRNHSRLIDDPRNSLYREFVRIVARLEPRAFVMENVLGLEQMGAKDQILEDLGSHGMYRVTAQVLDAADFGVPQTRRRIVFSGIHSSFGLEPPLLEGTGGTQLLFLNRRNGNGQVRYKVCEHAGSRHIVRLRDPDDPTLVTAEQAIGDLADLKAGETCDEMAITDLPTPSSRYQRQMRARAGATITNVSVPRINADTKIRLSGLNPGGNYRDLPGRMMKRYLTGELWGPNNGTGRLGRRHYYAYRRLHPGFWSWTLNTKADSVYHYEIPRALSVREFARLQSFPDHFRFITDPRRGDLPGRIEGGAAHSRYRQVGNAVPPLLARALAAALLELLRPLGGTASEAN